MRFIFLDSVGSTNEEARQLWDTGEVGPLWIAANAQTSGRGRRGRSWASESGNLYASGLYPHFGDSRQAAHHSFVAALAVAETLESYIPKELISLKWPNDVLVNGAKISGILLEGGADWIIIGIGINLVSHPPDTPYPATHMLEHIPAVKLDDPEPVMTGPQAMLPLLVERFDHWRHELITAGFESIRKAWLARAKGLPGLVTVNLQSESFRCEAITLGQNGELQVRLDNGTIRNVQAGDVFFG